MLTMTHELPDHLVERVHDAIEHLASRGTIISSKDLLKALKLGRKRESHYIPIVYAYVNDVLKLKKFREKPVDENGCVKTSVGPRYLWFCKHIRKGSQRRP